MVMFRLVSLVSAALLFLENASPLPLIEPERKSSIFIRPYLGFAHISLKIKSTQIVPYVKCSWEARDVNVYARTFFFLSFLRNYNSIVPLIN